MPLILVDLFKKHNITLADQIQKRKYVIGKDLLGKADYDAKITEVKSKIPNITGLAITAAPNGDENDILNVNISDIEKKFFTNPDYSNFMSEILDAKIIKIS